MGSRRKRRHGELITNMHRRLKINWKRKREIFTAHALGSTTVRTFTDVHLSKRIQLLMPLFYGWNFPTGVLILLAYFREELSELIRCPRKRFVGKRIDNRASFSLHHPHTWWIRISKSMYTCVTFRVSWWLYAENGEKHALCCTGLIWQNWKWNRQELLWYP